MAHRHDEQTKHTGIGRRDFLARAAAVGAGLAAGLAGRAHAADAKPEARNTREGVLYRRLGRTNLGVSALAFGGVVLTTERMPAFEAAVDRGVNFVMVHDGKCTDALAPWLKKPANRNRVFLGLCGGPRNLDAQLGRLGTDCVDLLMVPIHAPGPVRKDDLPKAFDALRKAGKARFLCLVAHSNVPGVWKSLLETDWFDAFLPVYNLASRAELKPLIAETKKKDIGLMAMKTLKGMPKGAGPVATWRTFLDDGFDVILKGMTSAKEVDAYAPLATKGGAGTARLPRIDCTGECSLCGACEACPQGIAIQDTLRTWQYYGQQLGWTDVARAHYAAIPPDARASVCADCGRCELVCPQGLNVRRLLAQAHAALA